MATRAVWGCLECGTLSESLTDDRRCPACKDGLVCELGGDPSAEKAAALIAWARRDATERIESRGTLAGGAAGILAALGLAAVLGAGGLSLLLVLVYVAVVGAVGGHALALAAHRRLRPHSRLQPIVDTAAAQRERWVLWALLGLGVVAAVAIGAGLDDHALRRGAGHLLGLFTAE